MRTSTGCRSAFSWFSLCVSPLQPQTGRPDPLNFCQNFIRITGEENKAELSDFSSLWPESCKTSTETRFRCFVKKPSVLEAEFPCSSEGKLVHFPGAIRAASIAFLEARNKTLKIYSTINQMSPNTWGKTK